MLFFKRYFTVSNNFIYYLNQTDDGTFWIEFEDFCHSFRIIYSCHIFRTSHCVEVFSEWNAETSGGCLKCKETFGNNPQFLLKGCGKVSLVLSQNEIIDSNSIDEEPRLADMIACGMYAINNTSGKRVVYPWSNEIVDRTAFQYMRDIVLEIEVIHT